jgi:hypothetical protein
MVVELFPERLEGGRDVRVIHQPAELGVAGAGDDDFRREAVAVEAPAFVGLRQVRQQVGGFKLKSFAKFDGHSQLKVKNAKLKKFEGYSFVFAPDYKTAPQI